MSPSILSAKVGRRNEIGPTESRMDNAMLCGDGDFCVAKERLQQSGLKLEIDQGVPSRRSRI